MPSKSAKPAGAPSAFRLRVGVLLMIVWWVPLWALGPAIAQALTGQANPPSAAAVTTAIAVVQTLIGVLGFWLAGTEVKSIMKGSSRKQAVRALWSTFRHGQLHKPGNGST